MQSFWSTDLTEIESSFLPKGVKITDLPTTLDALVPHQGSVLLDNVINIDDIVSSPSFLSEIKFKIKVFFR